MDGVSLKSRVSLGDLSLNEHGRLNAEELGICVEQLAGVVFLEPLRIVADVAWVHRNLLVGVVVHEDVVLAVVVEVLHLAGDQLHTFELGPSIAGLVINGTAILEILDGVADKGTALAGLDVLELHDCIVVVSYFEAHPVAKICCADSCGCHWCCLSFLARLQRADASHTHITIRQYDKTSQLPHITRHVAYLS